MTGFAGDADWADGADIPQSAKPIKVTASTMEIVLRLLDVGGADVPRGAMTVDAEIVQSVNGARSRNLSLVESTGAELSATVKIIADDMSAGGVAWPRIINLTSVPGAAVVMEIIVVSGGRVTSIGEMQRAGLVPS